MSHYNQLTPAEAERLALLLEELGEAQQVVGKILRHGYESYNPHVPDQHKTTNRKLLEKELGDAHYAMLLMCHCGDLRAQAIHTRALAKSVTVQKWFHHNEVEPFVFKQFL